MWCDVHFERILYLDDLIIDIQISWISICICMVILLIRIISISFDKFSPRFSKSIANCYYIINNYNGSFFKFFFLLCLQTSQWLNNFFCNLFKLNISNYRVINVQIDYHLSIIHGSCHCLDSSFSFPSYFFFLFILAFIHF